MKAILLVLFAAICAASIFLISNDAKAQTPGPQIGAYLPYYEAGYDQYEHPPYVANDPWDIGAFQANTGHYLDIFLWYQDWRDKAYSRNPNLKIIAQADEGHVIELAWEPHNLSPGDACYSSNNSGKVDLQEMATPSSCYETNYLIPWAQDLATLPSNVTVLFRPMSEMNGSWTDWGTNNPTNLQYFKTAWQHIHDVFIQNGATNVKFLWAANVDGDTGSEPNPAPGTSYFTYDHYYPGDSYVDYMGIDGYNFGCYTFVSYQSSWQELAKVLAPSYDVFANKTTKEIMLAETSSPEGNASNGSCSAPYPSKASWITNSFSWLPYRFPRITRFTWFNHNLYDPTIVPPPGQLSLINFRIDSNSNSTAAFNRAVQTLYDRNYFINFTDNGNSYNWLLAANPIATNNSTPVSPDFNIAGGSSQKLSPDPINPDTTSNRFLSGTGGPVRLTTHEINQTNHVDTKVIMSQRTLWPTENGNLEEVPGRDYRKFSDHYYWPWYDMATPGVTDWVVVSNLNPFDVWCEIRIAGAPRWSGVIHPNDKAAPTFAGTLAGPVEVQTWVSDTDGSGNQKKLSPAYCVPSQRVLYNNRLNELHGIPASELSDRYLWTFTTGLRPGPVAIG